MKTHIQISHKEGKVERKEMRVRIVNGSEQLSYWYSGTLIFLECSSVLNAAPVTNAFWSYTGFSKCFFFLMFLFFILFYRLSDKVLMKTYSLCGLCGDKKAFKEKKICGAIASKWILFIWSFFLLSQKLNILSSISFLHYESQNNKIFGNVLEFREQVCAIERY